MPIKHPLADRYIQARNYTAVPGRRRLDVIVIHDMEAPEKAVTAENVAAWFAGPDAPRASAHFNIDSDSIVQGVQVNDVAWAAPGANHNGIQFEHSGYARQVRSEWLDEFGVQMLDRSARLAAALCQEHGIPVQRVTATGLLRGERGITGHGEVSDAFRRSDHHDPGSGFPWDWYLDRVRGYLAQPALKAPWTATVGGRVIGRGSMTSPAFLSRIAAALRETGRLPPWKAVVDGRLIATGRMWPLGAFTRTIGRELQAGRTVTVNNTVTIRKEDQ